MQEILTIQQRDVHLLTTGYDQEVNVRLSEGWTVANVAFIPTGDNVYRRIFTLIRDIPDATKAQAAPPREKPREFRVGQEVSATLYGEIVAINGYEIKVDFDELSQPIVCVEQQLEPLNTD